jgi:hypothetical protein
MNDARRGDFLPDEEMDEFYRLHLDCVVIPGRARSGRTRNLEIPGLRFAHPGMTAI